MKLDDSKITMLCGYKHGEISTSTENPCILCEPFFNRVFRMAGIESLKYGDCLDKFCFDAQEYEDPLGKKPELVERRLTLLARIPIGEWTVMGGRWRHRQAGCGKINKQANDRLQTDVRALVKAGFVETRKTKGQYLYKRIK